MPFLAESLSKSVTLSLSPHLQKENPSVRDREGVVTATMTQPFSWCLQFCRNPGLHAPSLQVQTHGWLKGKSQEGRVRSRVGDQGLSWMGLGNQPHPLRGEACHPRPSVFLPSLPSSCCSGAPQEILSWTICRIAVGLEDHKVAGWDDSGL